MKAYFTGLTKQNIHTVSIYTVSCEDATEALVCEHGFLVLKLYARDGYLIFTKDLASA